MPKANAYPTKTLFIGMLTRDVSLEGAILDLIDNSIDSFLRVKRPDFIENPATLLQLDEGQTITDIGTVEIRFANDKFEIFDDCGGITYEDARDNIMRFGKVASDGKAALSVYGIGLKRALFKIGKTIQIISSHPSSRGFRISIDVNAWVRDDDPDTWYFDMKPLPKGAIADGCTKIVVTDLYPEILSQVMSGTFESRLHESIGEAYGLLPRGMINIRVNGVSVMMSEIVIRDSNDIKPAIRHLSIDGITCTVIVGATMRSAGGQAGEVAGWYIVCNGRVVLAADKTRVTGWGRELPSFHPKHRPFIGVVYFFSENAAALPWTTNKQGVHTESRVYQDAYQEMMQAARPVIRFLDRLYAASGEEPESPVQRDILRSASGVGLRSVASRQNASFYVSPKKKEPPTTVRVQFDVKIEDIERAKVALKKPNWSGRKVAAYAFEYFLRNECSE